MEVTVNGKPVQVVNAPGWLGLNNVYRVDFRVPDGVRSGLASLSMTVAWIAAPEVRIPVQ